MAGIMTSGFFSDCVQNSAFQVLSEGSLKAVGRPMFTMADKSASPEARKYSALKEFTFQTMSMVLYGIAITTLVKKGGYKLLRKLPVYNEMDACKTNKTLKAFSNAFDKVKEVKAKEGAEALKAREFALVKGAMEQISMIGSGIILTILCPMLVSKMVHPVMEKYDDIMAKKQQKKELNKVV